MFQTAGSFPVTDLANSDGQFFSAGFGSGVVDSPSPPPLFAEEDGDTFIATLRDWHLLRKKPPEDDPAAAEPPLTDEPSEPPPVSPPQQVFRLNRSGLQHGLRVETAPVCWNLALRGRAGRFCRGAER